MAALPQLRDTPLLILQLLGQPRPGQLDTGKNPRTACRCVVHDVDIAAYRIRPPYWSVNELAQAADLANGTVRNALRTLVATRIVQDTWVSCRCIDKMWRAADREVGRKREPDRKESQAYYRLTELGRTLLEAHPARASSCPDLPPPGM